jgi:hypothetical protein
MKERERERANQKIRYYNRKIEGVVITLEAASRLKRTIVKFYERARDPNQKDSPADAVFRARSLIDFGDFLRLHGMIE